MFKHSFGRVSHVRSSQSKTRESNSTLGRGFQTIPLGVPSFRRTRQMSRQEAPQTQFKREVRLRPHSLLKSSSTDPAPVTAILYTAGNKIVIRKCISQSQTRTGWKQNFSFFTTSSKGQGRGWRDIKMMDQYTLSSLDDPLRHCYLRFSWQTRIRNIYHRMSFVLNSPIPWKKYDTIGSLLL